MVLKEEFFRSKRSVLWFSFIFQKSFEFVAFVVIYGSEDKSSSDSKQSLDYDYNEEDDTSTGGSHGDGRIQQPKATLMPYFEHNSTTVYLSGDQDKLQLKCHPKNFDGKLIETNPNFLHWNSHEILISICNQM